MPWVSDMNHALLQLCDIDLKIHNELTNDVLNTEEILALVDIRDQILQPLLEHASKNEQFAASLAWQKAIHSTQALVELMTAETTKIGHDLRKFRIGQKSVQQYKKF
jgi:flagellar rod protein FlaI